MKHYTSDVEVAPADGAVGATGDVAVSAAIGGKEARNDMRPAIIGGTRKVTDDVDDHLRAEGEYAELGSAVGLTQRHQRAIGQNQPVRRIERCGSRLGDVEGPCNEEAATVDCGDVERRH